MAAAYLPPFSCATRMDSLPSGWPDNLPIQRGGRVHSCLGLCYCGRSLVVGLPQFECVGAREHWLDLDPRALREWAMAPLALGIGLYPPDPNEAARVPRRAQVDDVEGQVAARSCLRGPGPWFASSCQNQVGLPSHSWAEQSG